MVADVEEDDAKGARVNDPSFEISAESVDANREAGVADPGSPPCAVDLRSQSAPGAAS